MLRPQRLFDGPCMCTLPSYSSAKGAQPCALTAWCETSAEGRAHSVPATSWPQVHDIGPSAGHSTAMPSDLGEGFEHDSEDDSGYDAGWRQKAANAVESARTQHATQAFAVSGHVPDMPFSVATALQVAGLPGYLHLPVTAQQVSALLALGQPAPYGRGSETVLDSTVRKATQIDIATVHASEVWQQQVQQLTARVTEGLGVDTRVQVAAHPYKLLVYMDGGHFVAHKDTEKEPGMFGTLVVQLPVEGGHKGGEFVFKHRGKTVQWNTADNSDTTFQYAAFYADVEHELRAITAGARVVMVYNLVRTGTGDKPTAAESGKLVKKLRAAVRSWEQALTTYQFRAPKLLCVPLDHQYTQSSLSFESLKGADAKVVACLNHPQAGLDVHLVLMTETEVYVDEEYSREGGMDDRRGGRYSDSDCNSEGSNDMDLDMDEWRKDCGVPGFMQEMYLKRCDEHIETVYSLNTCVSLTGNKLPRKVVAALGLLKPGGKRDSHFLIGRMDNHVNPEVEWLPGGKVWDKKCIRAVSTPKGESDGESRGGDEKPHQKMGKLQPIAAHFVPYGNEGATVDKIYHVAMAVIWPRSRTTVMLKDDGSLRMAAHILGMRTSQGGEAEIEASLQQISKAFGTANTKQAQARSTGSYPSQHPDADVSRALQAVAKAPVQLAVPTMLSIIPWLRSLGNVGDAEESGGNLPDVLVQCVATLGTPDALVQCLASWIKESACKETAQCCALAKAAASHSERFGTILTNALVAEIIPSDAHEKRQGVKWSVLADLAALLCKLPECRRHLHALVNFALNSGPGRWHQDCYRTEFVEKLLQFANLKSIAEASQAVVAVVQARREKLIHDLGPKPEITWEIQDVTVPDNPEVEAFLRGPEQTFTMTSCFEGEQQAYDWVASSFKEMSGDFKIQSSVAGNEKQVTLTLKKTHWNATVYEYNLQRLEPEFQRLDELLRICEHASAAASTET